MSNRRKKRRRGGGGEHEKAKAAQEEGEEEKEDDWLDGNASQALDDVLAEPVLKQTRKLRIASSAHSTPFWQSQRWNESENSRSRPPPPSPCAPPPTPQPKDKQRRDLHVLQASAQREAGADG